MDFKELMRIAKENKERSKKECAENKRYDTKLPPPKKELKAVNVKAVRARLLQKEEVKKEKAAEEERKKQELLKLRAASQTGKKGKSKGGQSTKTSSKERSHDDRGSSSSRSRHGDEERQPKTSKHGSSQYEDDEHEFRHQHFMETVAKEAKKNREREREEEERAAIREKKEKQKKKPSTPPKPGPMSYDEILKMAAERQKGGGKSGQSSNVTKQQDEGYRTNKITTSFNKKHKDRNDKQVTIGKRNLKEAAEKYKPGNSKVQSGQSSGSQKTQSQKLPIENGRLTEAAEKYKPGNSKTESGQSSGSQKIQSKKPPIGNGRLKETAEKYKPKSKPSKANPSSSQERPLQATKSKSAPPSRKSEYTNKITKKEMKPSQPQTSKKPDKIVAKKSSAQMSGDKDRRKPMSSGDRDRPHASYMNRDRPRASDTDFRRPVAKKRPAPPLPRMKAKHGRLLSDDESDYEEDGFIDDTPLDDAGADVSSYIRDIFGYDKSKYGFESDYALRAMDASYKDIQKEEARSARLGMQEDLEDMRREKEEEQRKRAKASKKKGKR